MQIRPTPISSRKLKKKPLDQRKKNSALSSSLLLSQFVTNHSGSSRPPHQAERKNRLLKLFSLINH